MRFPVGLLLAVLLVGGGVSPSMAQYSQIPDHKAEIHVFGGYVWTFSRSGTLFNPDPPPTYINGKVDLADNGYWGVSLDLNLAQQGPKIGQLTLMFRQEPTQLTVQEGGLPKQTLTDVNVNYWQIGGIGGMPRGKTMPFGSFTLGATQYDWKGPASQYSDTWKFSMIFGLGAKIYASERLGVKIQANFPFTFFSSGFGIGCGTGGCGGSFGGTGLAQIDVGGGLFLNFGGS